MLFGLFKKTKLSKNLKVVSKFKVPLFRQKMTKADGFKSEKEALDFGNNSCGAACVKMVLEAFGKSTPSVKELMLEGMEKKYYKEPVGWIHQGIIDLIKDYGLTGKRVKAKFPLVIADKLKADNLIIASVGESFKKNKRGGHLIVIYGIEIDNYKLKKIFFNDPSGWGQTHHEIDGNRFLGSWSGNIICISRP